MDPKKPSDTETIPHTLSNDSEQVDSSALEKGLSALLKDGNKKKTPSSDPQQDPLIGRTLAQKYLIQRKLGAGGFGAVYEAEHLLLDSKIAIKTLHTRAELSQTILERFRREALAASRLTHLYAVKIYDRGETDDGLAWLAMELLQGETLSAFLRRRGHIPEQELIELMEPLCEVLQEAHEKGIIHRDLKPENIMLVPSKKGVIPKILDFGIAAILTADTLTQTGTVSGTPRYMAPEQWEGLKRADVRSDIYSLGMIAYQCLTGRFPFEADSPLSWMKNHYFEKPLPLHEALQGKRFSPEIQAAVMRAISKDAKERQQTALDFFHSLKAGPENKTAEAPDTTVPIPKRAIGLALGSLSPTMPHLAPAPVAQPETKRSRIFFMSAVGATLLALLYVPALFKSPAAIEIKPVSSTPTTTIPVSSPITKPTLLSSTSEAAKTQQATPPVSEPATTAPTTLGASLSLDTVEECMRQSSKIDALMSACVAAEKTKNLSKETSNRIAEVKAQYKQQHIAAAKKAFAQQTPAGLAEGKRELANLGKYFPKSDSELKALYQQQQALESKLATVSEPPAVKSPQELLKEAEGYEAAKKINDMCSALKRYLELYPNAADAAKIRAKIEAQDAFVYGKCEL